MKAAQSCPTLCDPMHYTDHGILQASILELVAFPFSRGSSQLRDRTQASRVCVCVCVCVLCVLVVQLCPALCNAIDYSLPGSSIHGVLQTRILEQVAISFSKKRDEKNSYHLNYT